MRVQFGRRFLVLYVLGVLCLGAVVIATLREDPGQDPSDPVSAALSAGATDGTGGDPDPDAPGGPGEGETSGRPPGSPPSDGADPGPGGIEADPGTGSETGRADPGAGPGKLPGTSPGQRRDPVVRTVDGPGSAEGELVDGHPRRVLPLAPGTRVLTSSVSPAPGRLQVTFTATGGEADQVLAFYRRHLSALGFREVPGRAASGAEAAFFAWQASSVVVTASPEDGSYAVFAVLRTRRT
ncbi:ICP22 family protein [Nocardioides ochotonae]|uniref:hypothetical protein n=1 Tax=Nocardioides ochotonae TaxID=2685869 RepID=UPI00140C44B9|nr:hypothetical protein [Nocardioides ochotonae]